MKSAGLCDGTALASSAALQAEAADGPRPAALRSLPANGWTCGPSAIRNYSTRRHLLCLLTVPQIVQPEPTDVQRESEPWYPRASAANHRQGAVCG